MTKLNICICGGGSLGTVCAGVFLSQGHHVCILSGHPEEWSEEIEVIDCKGKKYSGNLSHISSDPQKAILNADLVLLCVPGFLIEENLKKIRTWLRSDSIVGSIVSSTGFFFIAHKILYPGTPLFGFQRVPFIARVKEYGKSAYLLGYKDSLTVALENIKNHDDIKNTLSDLFLTPIKFVDNFLIVSLTNSNPILHTGRMYSMWKESNGAPFPKMPLFYADWTLDSSETILKMDEEFQTLLRHLKLKGAVPSLLEYYESTDAKSLTDKIRSITAFKTIKSPMIETDKGWIFDFSSRYFTEDFPFGLKFIKVLAMQHNIETPTIDEVYEWGYSKIKN
ncbi:MAG: NAD/NADP octopine/nopaline dehydrogenase family protein [Muribaculaceae bacterium]|nr:NAD/NADP octopine/nopaline dehydrogenase family protein [Muribaculaceae bacterium]